MKISPSRLEFLALCPCFQYKETPRGGAADEGSAMHKAVETGDLSELETDEQIDSVSRFNDLLKVYMDQYPEGTRYPEMPVRLPNGIKGTLDNAIISKDLKSGVVLDSKFGRLGLVVDDASKSWQMACYAVGFFTAFPDLEQVEIVLAAPRTVEVLSHTYRKEDVPKIMAEMDKLIERIEDPFKVPTPCDALCAKCANVDRCPAITKTLVPAAKDIVGLEVGDLLSPVETLTEDQLSKNLAFLQVLDGYAETRKKSITELVLNKQLTLPYFSLRSKAGSVRVKSNAEALELLGSVVSTPVFIDCCGAVSLPKLAKAISTGDDKQAREDLEQCLAPILERGSDVRYLQRQAKLPAEKILKG